MSDLGAMFDPTIGPNGGYRISIDLDGESDDERGDVDANVTILLMADVDGKKPKSTYVILEVDDGRATIA